MLDLHPPRSPPEIHDARSRITESDEENAEIGAHHVSKVNPHAPIMNWGSDRGKSLQSYSLIIYLSKDEGQRQLAIVKERVKFTAPVYD